MMNPRDFIQQRLVEVVDEGKPTSTFYPPVPSQPQRHGRTPLTGAGLILELLPALARIVVELPREDQRRVNFQPGCPSRLALERITGMRILDCDRVSSQTRLVWLGRLARHALEIGDELHQFDGEPCLQFAGGFLAGETILSPLFSGSEAEAAALEYAAREYFGAVGSASRAFALGFQTRRDQLRAQRQAELDNF